jgi:hypothetical protein
MGAVVALAVSLRAVGTEARALRTSVGAWGRMAVAIADLEHESRRVERELRRVTHR